MVGKDHLVLCNAAFGRVGFFNLKKTKQTPFSTSLLILVESVVLIALKKTLRGKLISWGLLGVCVALCFLGWMH